MSSSLKNKIGAALLALFFLLAAMNVETVQARVAMNETVAAWASMNETVSAWATMNETAQAEDETVQVEDETVRVEDISFYKLALQWPGSFAQSCHPRALDFSIHGLWPTLRGDKPALNCMKLLKLNIRETIDPIRGRMQSEWPSLKCGTCDNAGNNRFWTHEWQKHGTCWMLLFPRGRPISYFNKAHSLNERVNLLRALKNKRIYPSHTQYNFIQIHDAFKASINGVTSGYEVQIKCNDRNQLLSEVYICVDLQFQFMNCPGNWSIGCGQRPVVFPPAQTSMCVN